ncbi:MAG: type II secretion system F family protein [Candidatus Levyibacteriota bacterium]
MNNQNISISNSEKLNLISNMATMLNAGIPILETVQSLMEGSKGNTKKILEAVQDDLAEGKHLYSSFSNFPNVFDKVMINIIKASEEAGTLDITLKDLKQQITKDIEFIGRVKGALIYPVLVFIVFAGIMLLMLVVVIPRISSVFLKLKISLPLPTKILIFASDALLHQTIPIILATVGVVFGFILLYRAQKRLVYNIVFSLPLVEKLIKEIDLTRFSRSLYLLLASGITINSALELAQDVVLKSDVSKAIAHAKETVLSGRPMSEGFKERKDVFSSIMIKIIEAGEKTGTLEKSMQDIAEYLDNEVSSTLKTLTVVLEPVMLVIVGILVGAMMISIIAPIYGLIGQVGAR